VAQKVRDAKFAPLKTKVLWMALFFVCFMVGRNIPLPLLHHTAASTAEASSDLLNAANIASGGNFFTPSFFSLGLGPWMTAAILWRFLFIGKIARDRKIPQESQDRARNAVMVILAVIQAIALMGTYDISGIPGPFAPETNAKIVIVIVLVAGACLVAWLANQNQDKGLGGVTMFILYQICITAVRNFEALSPRAAHAEAPRVFWIVAAAIVIAVLIGFLLGNSELRVHVNKISIDNGFTGVSYMPLKLNPAGASPIMYALTLLALPTYVAHAIAALAPGTQAGTDRFLNGWGLTTHYGFIAYLILLFALTIFFGLFTVNPKDTAKRMLDGGEYFDGVNPGAATRRFISGRVTGLSIASGILLVILAGGPLFFLRDHQNLQYFLMLPGTFIMVLALLWLLYEEIADTRIGTKYSFDVLPDKARKAAAAAARSTAVHSAATQSASSQQKAVAAA
jgi:preprotein translocase subunit SecY